MRNHLWLWFPIVCGLAESACADEPLPAAVEHQVSAAPAVRRLTRVEYDNTLRDLLGEDLVGEDTTLPPDARGELYSTHVLAQPITPQVIDGYQRRAEQVAARAASDPSRFLVCPPPTHEECVRTALERLAQRAYRGPLSSAERLRLFDLFAAGRTRGTDSDGLRWALSSILQSPRFLYRTEVSSVVPPAASSSPLQPHDADVSRAARIDSWEMASRLSYTLWQSMPDQELFDAAAHDRLATPTQIEKQARRMIDQGQGENNRTQRVVADFFAQWWKLDRLDTLTKDAKVYPSFSPEIPPLFAAETNHFVQQTLFVEHLGIERLLTAPSTWAGDRLRSVYQPTLADAPEGLGPSPGSPIGPTRVGFLQQGSFLATNAKPDQTSPILRGKFVREQLLCQPMPPPPAGLTIVLPRLRADATTRERFAEHASDPSCAVCHRLMDPIGLGFESFDAIGRFRATENGLPVDTTGEVMGTEPHIRFADATDLEQQLAHLPQVRACYLTQLFRYLMGQVETAADQDTMALLQEAYDRSGGNVESVLIALTQTDTFRYRRNSGPP